MEMGLEACSVLFLFLIILIIINIFLFFFIFVEKKKRKKCFSREAKGGYLNENKNCL